MSGHKRCGSVDTEAYVHENGYRRLDLNEH